MYPLITFLLENAAYAGFALTWAAHFCTARSYKRTARMVRQQETETQTSDSRPKEAISVIIRGYLNVPEEIRHQVALCGAIDGSGTVDPEVALAFLRKQQALRRMGVS